MNTFILSILIKRISNQKTKLLISSLTYYAILAFLPTLLLTMLILKQFHVQFHSIYESFFVSLSANVFSTYALSMFMSII